jgi:Uma2 family endonuclease
MTDPPTVQTMSAAAYLEWEREQLDKHEFHHGQVRERPVCSPRHCFLSAAICIELHRAADEHGCVALSSDMRIGTPNREHYVYPDCVVVCGRPQTETGTNDVLVNPAVVIEVLARNTEGYDRGLKWAAYRRLPSLTDYLLVSHTRRRIEHYQRETDNCWRYLVYQAGDVIALTVGARLAVDAVYERAFDLPGG